QLQGSDLYNPYWSCYFSSVVIIGVKDTGKTELKNYFRSLKATKLSQTDSIEIHLVEFEGSPVGETGEGVINTKPGAERPPLSNTYAVFLDGLGAEYADSSMQLRIIQMGVSIIKGPVIIIVLADHDPTKKDNPEADGFSDARRSEHKHFFDQARSFIRET